MSDLSLNEHHQTAVLNYMRFARYQRGQRLRTIDNCFDDVKETRLVEDTFNSEEVRELLDGLSNIVKTEVESELINTAHTNVLLLRQLLSQAEKWHLKLQADISELENRELLDTIKDFEEQEFSGAQRDVKSSVPLSTKSSKLEPLNEGGAVPLLQLEIDRLKTENDKLRERQRTIEMQASSFLQEKTQLSAELLRVKSELESLYHTSQEDNNSSAKTNVEEIQNGIAAVRLEMEKTIKESESSKLLLESDLSDTKHRLLQVQAQLELAEKEMEKKFSETTAFLNLKQMLSKKNDLIKELRKKIVQYEPDAE